MILKLVFLKGIPHKKKGVWKFFEIIKNENGSQEIKCLVKNCGKVLKTSKMSNKSALGHLKSKKHQFADVVINPPEIVGTSPKITKYAKQVNIKDTIESKIAKLVGLSGITMNKLATDNKIRELIHSKYKVWPPKNHTSISKIVIDHCEEVMEAIKTEIKGLKSFTVMFDEWTSRSNERYLNLIMRTESTEYNLGVIKVDGSATATNLLNLIKEKLKIYDISMDDIFSMTADGASVNKKLAGIGQYTSNNAIIMAFILVIIK